MAEKEKIKQSEKVNVQLQFTSIELLSGTIHAPRSLNPISQFNFNITIETQIDEVKEMLFAIVSVEITDVERIYTYGSLVASCIYSVANFNEVIKKDDNGKYNIPQALVEVVNSVSISTARGIMFSTFKGTFLHNAIIPLVDPKQIVSNWGQPKVDGDNNPG